MCACVCASDVQVYAVKQACIIWVGIAVKESALRVEDHGFESHLCLDFSRLSHTSDFKIGTPVATLQGSWHHGVSAGTGGPGVSIL